MSEFRGGFMVVVTVLVALLLQILPLPAQFASFRPDWVVACLVYWSMALPHRINIGTAFVVGLLLDILLGSTMGVRALALSLVAYLVAVNFTRLRNFSLWQQAIIVGLLTLLSKLVIYWVEYVLNGAQMVPGYLDPVFSTAVIWPWVFLLLRKIRRRFRME